MSGPGSVLFHTPTYPVRTPATRTAACHNPSPSLDRYTPGLAVADGLPNYRMMLAATAAAPRVPTPGRCHQIGEVQDPAQRNRQITDAYADLSQGMRDTLGPGSGANWTTWAAWASSRAGASIRKEDLPTPLRIALSVAAPAAGMSVEALLSYVSGHIAQGNKKVFEEIAPVFSRFVQTFRDEKSPNPQRFQEFLKTIPEDKPKLRQAFTLYYQAKYESNPREKRELMVRANVLVGEHEQARLDQNIDAAMMRNLPIGGGLMARLVTYMMGLQIPGRSLSLSQDVPGRPGTAAGDWSEYDQRMRYIGAMFDRFHDDPSLFQRP